MTLIRQPGGVRHLLALILLVVSACGRPLMRPEYTVGSGEDDPAAGAVDLDDDPVAAEAPAAVDLRMTGDIARAALNEVLDAGPAAFLGRVRVKPYLAGDRFRGWQVERMWRGADVDLIPGDVVVRVNGRSCERPDDFQEVWDGLRFATELSIEYLRGDETRFLRFAIVDAVLRLAH